MAGAQMFVENIIASKRIVLFSKTYCPECKIVKNIFSRYSKLTNKIILYVEIEKRSDCTQVQYYLWKLSGARNGDVPMLFVNGRFVGNYTIITRMEDSYEMKGLIDGVIRQMKEEKRGDVKDDKRYDLVASVMELEDNDMCIKVDSRLQGCRAFDYARDVEGCRQLLGLEIYYDPWEEDPDDEETLRWKKSATRMGEHHSSLTSLNRAHVVHTS